jgi:hypothetical protein
MTEDPILKVWLLEYDTLKAEQTQRIGFRDNQLYVTLGLFGTIVSFAASNSTNYYLSNPPLGFLDSRLDLPSKR